MIFKGENASNVGKRHRGNRGPSISLKNVIASLGSAGGGSF